MSGSCPASLQALKTFVGRTYLPWKQDSGFGQSCIPKPVLLQDVGWSEHGCDESEQSLHRFRRRSCALQTTSKKKKVLKVHNGRFPMHRCALALHVSVLFRPKIPSNHLPKIASGCSAASLGQRHVSPRSPTQSDSSEPIKSARAISFLRAV